MKEVKNVKLHVTVERWMLEDAVKDYGLELDAQSDRVVQDFAMETAMSLLGSGLNNAGCKVVINRQ